MLNIVLFGPPGSGKGTQSLNITNKYNLVHLSTGDILREAVKNMTPLGSKVKAFLDKGELVPDDLVIDIMAEKTNGDSDKKGFVFDGFPRTLYQAEKLDKILSAKKIPITIALAINVSEDELFRRMLGRKQTESRSDDNEDVIKNRLNVYKSQTLPLFDYYKKQNKLELIEGMSTIEDVFSRISQAIDKHIPVKKN
jgi:adenylate kinase